MSQSAFTASESGKPDYPTLNYDSWARSVSRDNLWGQVRRTVGGKPVSPSDIAAIVSKIDEALSLERHDVLIDFACGNGALASHLFSRVGGYLGSDISPYLIGIAKERFADARNGINFRVSGAADHVLSESDPDHFTKALCYGSFAYLSDDEAWCLLDGVYRRFPRISRLFVGNLPDRDRACSFYGEQMPSAAEMADPSSRIGIWRSRSDITYLAEQAGWSVSLSTMPTPFFAAHYRFDALFTRLPPGPGSATARGCQR
jgi:SAM-dependent methyltransferase